MYQPPPQKSVGVRPRSRIHAPSRRTRSPVRAAARPCVRRAREVRVVAECAARRRLARAGEPQLLVGLARLGVRRPQQRRDRETPRPALLERRERGPDAVVERSFDVARDHCVPFRSRGRHRATDTTRCGPPGRCRRRPPAPARAGDRARADPRGLCREERRLRADARRERHVRLPARGPVGVHAAALRLVPRRALLAARPLVGGGGARTGAAGGRHGAAGARDRHAPRVRANRRARCARRDAAPVPRLARHPRQPRDPGRAARGGDRPSRAARVRAPLAPAGARARCGDRARDPLQRPPAAPAARPGAVRRVARPAGRTRDRRGRARRRRRRPGDGPLGGSEQGGDRVRDDHDGHARALEGEQPGDLRRAGARRLDRRRARPARRAPLAGEGRRDLGGGGEGGGRVRAVVVLPRRGASTSGATTPARRRGSPCRPSGCSGRRSSA